MSSVGIGVGGDAQGGFVERDRLRRLGDGGDEALVDRCWLTHGENGSRAVPSPGMSDGMYPGAHAASTPDKPAYIMAATGEVVTYAELDAAANRLSQVFHAARAAPGRSRRLLPGEPPPLPRDRVGRALRRPDLHRVLVPAHVGRAGLHRQRLRAPRRSSPRRTRPSRRPRSSADTPEVRAAPHARRRPCAGYDSLRGGRRRAAGRAAARPARAAPTCSTRRAPRAGPKGVKAPRARRAARRPTARSASLCSRCCSGSPATTIYLSPAPLYHSAPLRFNMAIAAHRRHVGRSWSTSTRRQFLALIERYQVTAHAVVPTMFIRMLKLPEEVRDRSTTCRRCSPSCTPRRRARSP